MASAAIYVYMCVCVCVCAYFSPINVPLSQICGPCYPSFGGYPCLGAPTCRICCSQLLRLSGCSCCFLFFICHPWWHIQPLSQRREKKTKHSKTSNYMKTFFDLSTRLTYTIIPKKGLWPKICHKDLPPSGPAETTSQTASHPKGFSNILRPNRLGNVGGFPYDLEPISQSQTTGGTSKLQGMFLTTIIPNHPFIRALLGSYFLAIGGGYLRKFP